MKYEETQWWYRALSEQTDKIVDAIRKIPGPGGMIRIPDPIPVKTFFISWWLFWIALGVWSVAIQLNEIAEKL